jgi:hypothetical protein
MRFAIWVVMSASSLVTAAFLGDLASEEVHTRLARLPYLLIRLTLRGVPAEDQQELRETYEAELDFIEAQTEGLPITRLCRSLYFSMSLLRTVSPLRMVRPAKISVSASVTAVAENRAPVIEPGALGNLSLVGMHAEVRAIWDAKLHELDQFKDPGQDDQDDQ